MLLGAIFSGSRPDREALSKAFSNPPLWLHGDFDKIKPLATHFFEHWSFLQPEPFDEFSDACALTVVGAAMMAQSGRDGFFDDTMSVYLLQSAIVTDLVKESGGIVSLEHEAVLGGEAICGGTIALSWEDICDDDDGYNVIIHELAHQLDCKNGGEITGTPVLCDDAAYRRWGKVFSAAFKRLEKESRKTKGEHDVLDTYALEDEGEFFAVAAESFFGNPLKLAGWDAALYEELVLFFGFDPLVDHS